MRRRVSAFTALCRPLLLAGRVCRLRVTVAKLMMTLMGLPEHVMNLIIITCPHSLTDSRLSQQMCMPMRSIMNLRKSIVCGVLGVVLALSANALDATMSLIATPATASTRNCSDGANARSDILCARFSHATLRTESAVYEARLHQTNIRNEAPSISGSASNQMLNRNDNRDFSAGAGPRLPDRSICVNDAGRHGTGGVQMRRKQSHVATTTQVALRNNPCGGEWRSVQPMLMLH